MKTVSKSTTFTDIKKGDLYDLIDIGHQASKIETTTELEKASLTFINRIVGSHSSAYCKLTQDSRKIKNGDWVDKSAPNGALKEWCTKYQSNDPFFQGCLKKANSGDHVVRSTDVINERKNDFFSSRFYNEFMREHSFYHMLSIALPTGRGNPIAVISLQRPKHERRFSKQDITKANLFARVLGPLVERIQLQEKLSETVNEEEAEMTSDNINFVKHRLRKYRLTNRELDVICLIRKGFTSGEIANPLNISERTVNNHIQSIYKKAAVHNRTSLLYLLTS